MKKNMYSLMLAEDVVAAIDALARLAGANRSQMINSILAEYVSYRTPEQRMREMFDQMEALLGGNSALQVMLRSSESMMSLRSPLTFKYNPTIRYNVELYPTLTPVAGELRVSLRSQNHNLLLYLSQFYKLWGKLSASVCGSGDCQISDGRFTKWLAIEPGGREISEEELSRGIVEYISVFDGALKAFFYNLDQPAQAISQVENIYRRYVAGKPLIL
ncbi:MAG: hypothetical protein K6B40_03575 [Firmicutes bacterium]|nr:hypothetical protein [Bacillota bacterium]